MKDEGTDGSRRRDLTEAREKDVAYSLKGSLDQVHADA
jgi:hypothetical protein